MPLETQLAHRVITNLALPYITNISPASTEPHFTTGSTNILTSINGYAERRPGFATSVETVPTVFNNLQRLFTWDRFDDTFFVMACDVNASGFSQVFKMQVGTDPSFLSIFTDTSGTPFDFVVSNNTLYFSNGNTAKKWDPVNGLSNWGIAIGSVNNAVTDLAGTGADLGGAHPWTNPNNVTSATNFATVTLTNPASGFVLSNFISATNFSFAIPAASTITGIAVTLDIKTNDTSLHADLGDFPNMQLLKAGVPTGTAKFAINSLNNTVQTFTLGGPGDLWGSTWVPNDVNQTTFGVRFQADNFDNTGGGFSTTFSVRNVNITIYGLGGPTVAVQAGAGGMNAAAGYTYVFCYGNSATGHISSPTPASASTGIFTNKAGVNVTLTASTDTQVNQIRVFRTTDGGGATYFELPTSPYANSNAVISDSAADASLQVGSIAPTPTFNDPPPPFQGMTYFAGRIWGFVGNKVWFSGLEEINQGVPEESFPSGTAGNFWSFDQPVQALSVAGIGTNQVQGILCGGRVYGVTGNTLDTFRRFIISTRRGCRNLTCISSLGGMVAWLDSSNMIFGTDGVSVEELSTMVRPDFLNLNPANCSMTFHTAGRFHWLVLSTGTKLYVYDVDQDQWMPPWTFAAKYIFSGEISPGNYVLMASNGTKALQLNPSAFNDNAVT